MQNFGVAQDRPGQRDPLPLAAGEAAAAGADERLVAVGQLLHDERVGVGLAGGGFDLGPASRRACRSDVVRHRVVEQQHLLRDQAEAPAQIAESHVADVDAVDRDPATVGS